MAGGSTITQQVARQFFLSNEYSYTRKLAEMLLAMRIERMLTKDQILELYLNEIFLGQNSYGVAAAAQTYFNKQLDQLAPHEAAMLAAMAVAAAAAASPTGLTTTDVMDASPN